MGQEKQIRIELTAEVAGAVVEALERVSREMEAKIIALRLLVSKGGGVMLTPGTTGRGKQKRSFSAATRKKMAESQRKRWAEKKLSSARA